MGFVVETHSGNVAFSIALGVLLLTVVLQPIIEACVHRIRAARAWRAIQNNEAVDITKYNFLSEILGDRGKWDTARVVAIMMAAFHVSTWGLELSLDLAVMTDGPVDLLNRPPPVFSNGDPDAAGSSIDWMVERNVKTVGEEGTLGNFKGTLEDGYATSVYRIGDAFVRGSKVIATWSTEPVDAPAALFYDEHGEGGYARVTDFECSTTSASNPVYLSDGQNMEHWGTATECEIGPRLVNATADESPPTIILNGSSSTGTGTGTGSETPLNNDVNVHLIVEEDSSYPSFMYSVWRPVSAGPDNNASGPTELHHQFFVSSTTRLAEAIVSGVANGILSGGGCVDLLSQFSVANTTYELGAEMSRVAPFGEYPSSSSVESVDEVEEIVAGVNVSEIGVISGLILLVVTGASFAGCVASIFSGKPMDVFDRDAVIRAVALPNGGHMADITSPALKIYVRQSDDNRFGMVVSDDDASRRRLVRRCIRRFTSACDGRSPDDGGSDDDDDDGPPLPARGLSRSWSLPRASFSRVSKDRERLDLPDLDEPVEMRERENVERRPVAPTPARTPAFVELIASPIPSLVRRGSQSVLRGLPTFFASDVTDTTSGDTCTDQGLSGTDHGLSSLGTSSRSQKRVASSAFGPSLTDRKASPDGRVSPAAQDIPPAGARVASSRGGPRSGTTDVTNTEKIEDDTGSQTPVGAGRANIPADESAVDGHKEPPNGTDTETSDDLPQTSAGTTRKSERSVCV